MNARKQDSHNNVTGRPSHRNNFDFLRLCFASMVVLSHSPELVDGDRSRELLTRAFHGLSFGELGVAGFFLLSGQLISKSWERSAGVVEFIRNRVLRIYPGFIVAALVTGLAFGPLGASSAREYFLQFDAGAFIKSVLKLGIPATPPTRVGNGALWTIQSEFICYGMVAFAGSLRLTKFKGLGPLVFLPIALLFAKKGVIFAPYNFYGFFFAGASFYHLRSRIRYTRTGAIIAGAILVPAMFHPVTAWLAICTVGAYVLFWFAFLPLPRLQSIARRADISYGTYLYAWPIQALLIFVCPGISPWLVFSVALPTSMLFGWMSWQLVEKRFLRLKRRAPRDLPAITPAASVD
jgi:peptidoglycan/LPS O-acetylase OafA/YrhL